MFRKRAKTILEDSLLAEGVDTYSPVGRNLLSRMIEHRYSQDRVAIEPLYSHLATVGAFSIIPVAGPGPLRACMEINIRARHRRRMEGRNCSL